MFTRFTEDSQSCEMVLLVAIASPNLAMMKSYFLLCKIFTSPWCSKDLFVALVADVEGNSSRPQSYFSALLSDNATKGTMEEGTSVPTQKLLLGLALQHWLVYPFPKVDSLIEYICGLFSIPKMGNQLHMVEFSTLGMVLLDGIPSEGLKASRFLCAHSSTRKLMYPGLPRRDNTGSLTIAASLNAVILPLSPWSMSFRPHRLNGLPNFMWVRNLEKVWQF